MLRILYRINRNIALGAILARLEYIAIADALAKEITAGKLKAGDRLPPQRSFAYERDIAISTASRVYGELLRRGLVIGEVGRGTFIAARPPATKVAETEWNEQRVDLEFNFPIIPDQAALVAKSLAGLHRSDVMDLALRPITSGRLAAAQQKASAFLAGATWAPEAEAFIFTSGGRQAIAAAISALVPRGGRLGVEALTYPMVKHLALRLGVTLVPIAMDEEGMKSTTIEKTHKTAPLSALYLQPILQNPLGVSMSKTRRAEISNVARKSGISIIEDRVYGFLADDEPLAAMAHDQCIVVDSLSKRIAPGFGLGYLCVPASLRERIANAVRAGAWSVSGLGLEAGQRLMSDGTAATIARKKRKNARVRQDLVAECLGGLAFQADQRAYHVWLTLPEGWRSESFVAAAARLGIAITPSSVFAVAPGHAPNAVRLALGLPPLDQLRHALTRLSNLCRSAPDETEVTE
jgi:DNA-binding transcriptional MocR family regulator